MIYAEITISKDKYRETSIVFLDSLGIKKLPSADGTDGSEGVMEILRQAQDDREMPDRVGHDERSSRA